MKILKGKSRRTKLFTLITFAIIIILFGLNLFLSVLGHRKSAYIDMTPEGLYSVTDRMVEECSFIDELDTANSNEKVKIIFCNDPDNLKDSTITRVTYYMALKLDKIFDNLEVETVNVNFNPTAVSKYKATSLSEINTSNIIVAYGNRYRVAGAESFWTKDSNGAYWSYNGEYKLATLLKSVTLANDSNPIAYYVTDLHEQGATVVGEQLKNLLSDRGLRVKPITLSTLEGDIPSDCALLIINNPTKDFVLDSNRLDEFGYVSATEKIDRYLTKNQGALMVAKEPGRSLPILEQFLSEWGFELSDTVVKTPKDESLVGTPGDTSDNRTHVINAVYDVDTESYGYAIYGAYASLSSSPKTVFTGAGDISCAYGQTTAITEPGALDVSRVYSSFLTSPANSVPYQYGSDSIVAGEAMSYDIAAVTTRTEFDNKTAEYTYSYVFCANDGDFFSDALLGNASYANYDIMSALINNISRMDIYASTDLGGTSLNTQNFGGKQLVNTALSEEDVEIYSADADKIVGINYGISKAARIVMTISIAAVPLAILIVGVVVFVKRKYM